LILRKTYMKQRGSDITAALFHIGFAQEIHYSFGSIRQTSLVGSKL